MSVGMAITAVAKSAITQKDHINAFVLMATDYLMMVSHVQVRTMSRPHAYLVYKCNSEKLSVHSLDAGLGTFCYCY